MYGVKIRGAENFKGLEGKPTLIVANHVSNMDGFLMSAMLPVIPAFAVQAAAFHNRWMKNPFTRFLFNRMDMFPVDPANPHSIRSMTKLAQSGKPVAIFPEGRLTRTEGTIMQVFEGGAAVADNADAYIVPVHLDGFEFLPYGDPQTRNHPRRWFPRLTVTAMEPRKLDIPEGLSRRERKLVRHERLKQIMHELPLSAVKDTDTLIEMLHKTARNYGLDRQILDDHEEQGVDYKTMLTGAYALGAKLKKVTAKGENVGFLLPNSRGAVVTFWGLQAYGRVPAMLNPKAGVSTMLSCTETACLKSVVTSKRFVEMGKLEEEIKALEEKGLNIVYLEDLEEKIGLLGKLKALMQAKGILGRYKERGTGTDPAVVLFTSGSEGVPKGVVLSSKNLLSNIAQVRAVTPFTHEDRVFNAMPLFHAFGLSGGMILPALSGVRSFQYPTPLDAKNIPKAVYMHDATIMFGTDTFLNLYARNADNFDFSRLKMIFAGAERLKSETYETYFERFGVKLYQGYGMTETSPVAAMNVPSASRKDTVGKFLPGMEIRLEDVPGVKKGKHLYVKGPNVMLGYLKNDNPGVVQAPENGWHDTGDIVAIDNKGYVSIVGRAKRFAKIGGEMVALDAVEAIAKAASPDAQFAHAVILRQDPDKGDSLIVYTTDPDLKREHLTKAAQDTGKSVLGLPKDADIHVVEELPLLATGKTDYPALSRLLETQEVEEATAMSQPPKEKPADAGDDFGKSAALPKEETKLKS